MTRQEWWVGCLLLCAILAGCTLSNGDLLPRSTQPVIKIGLVAPFEKRYRSLGYEVLNAVKWAVRERNEQGGVAGTVVELVALNDDDDPESSAFQAYKFAVDPDVVGVIGPFSGAAVSAAAPTYAQVGLTAITPATCPPHKITLQHDPLFCLGASVDDLAHALIQRLPDGARVTLLRGTAGPLGERLALTAERVIDGPWDEATRMTHPADVYLYDGDVLSAVDVLLRMRRAGIDVPLWGGPSLARTQLPQIATEATHSVCYAITAPLLADLSAGSAFVTGYRELSGGLPGPWAALAYDAAVLLLDALERDIVKGHATRDGVRFQLEHAQDSVGQPVFELGRRRQARTVIYCYEQGDSYPGRLWEPMFGSSGWSRSK